MMMFECFPKGKVPAANEVIIAGSCGVETLNNGSSYVIRLSIVVSSQSLGIEGCPRASRISTPIFPDTVISHVMYHSTPVELVDLFRFIHHCTGFGGDTTPAPHVGSIYGAREAQNAAGQLKQTIGLVILRKRKRQLKGLDLEGREWTILFELLILVQTHRYGRDTEMWKSEKGDDPWNEWVGIPIRHRVSNIQSQRRMYKYLLMDEEV
ncbi:hypothetical protein BO83DRAFT_412230 [Aspergillus eucalypticola CBS 122712]|uniref:Uncharacterized protein n=1 Tax=Aspergillus eucalypticola (strain CBS 122712 / IBT 29274) TaxID=1448314 RepID=A0A317ULU2_ASPEC|nr:uncharacterized protein BO83DRAFT_412230 [Aspergillus eucalypticola CBS 122712]PWY62923.1 hypothetical protein BO83DRAFT_412230 [Aspergillus eucalypticola CBS 122712]